MAPRILICDDEESMRLIAEIILKDAGYEPIVACNGREALALLDSGEKFDLITSDIANDGMWGTDFLVEVKRKFPEIRTLVITACRDLSEQPACIPKSAYDGYLQKPFEGVLLLEAVRRALAKPRGKNENPDCWR